MNAADEMFRSFEVFVKLSDERKDFICNHLHFLNITKGEFLWRAGQRCGDLFYIQTGILRLFLTTAEGSDQTVYFAQPGQFIADIDSMSKNTASATSCVAASDCEAICIKPEVLRLFETSVPEWHEIVRKITEKALFEKIRKKDTIFQLDAREKYIAFLEQFPSIANTVQASHIASYLGISQFTLSHIKKEIAGQHFLRNSKI